MNHYLQLADQIQKVHKKKNAADAPLSLISSLSKREQPRSACNVTSSLSFTVYDAHEHTMMSMPPMSTSLDAGEDVMSVFAKARPVDSGVATTTSVDSSVDFGHVWKILDDHFDDGSSGNSSTSQQVQSSDEELLSHFDSNSVFSDLEPVPFATDLTVAERLGARHNRFHPISFIFIWSVNTLRTAVISCIALPTIYALDF